MQLPLVVHYISPVGCCTCTHCLPTWEEAECRDQQLQQGTITFLWMEKQSVLLIILDMDYLRLLQFMPRYVKTVVWFPDIFINKQTTDFRKELNISLAECQHTRRQTTWAEVFTRDAAEDQNPITPMCYS